MAHNPSLQRMVKTLVPTLLHASLCQYWEHMWWLPFWHADSLSSWLYVLASSSCLPLTSHTKQPSKMFEGTSLLRSSEVNFEAGRGYPLAVQVAQQGQFTVLWFWHSLTNSLNVPDIPWHVKCLKCNSKSLLGWPQAVSSQWPGTSCRVSHELLILAVPFSAVDGRVWQTMISTQHRRNSLGDIFIAWLQLRQGSRGDMS